MLNEFANLILKSKNIFNSIDDFPFEGFIAIKDKKILEVGKEIDFNKFVNEDTKIIDLGDKLVMPGIIDVHTFFTGYAIYNIGLDFSNAISEDDFINILKFETDKNKDETIFGHGYDPSLLNNNDLEIKLSELYPEKSIIVFAYDRSTCLMNKKARKVYKFTPDQCYPEAYYRIMPKYLNDTKFISSEFDNYMKMMNSRGVTTVKEMGFDDFYGFDNYLKKREIDDDLSLRIFFMSQPVQSPINIENAINMREKFKTDLVRFSGFNRMTDGTVASNKGDLLEPYEGTNIKCSIDIDYGMIEKEVLLADQNDFRYSLHAQGDGAVHKVANIYDKCKKKEGKLVNRHCITDIEFSNPKDLEKLGKLGVIGEIYFQIMSLDNAEDIIKSINSTIGEKRAKYYWNRRKMLDSGMVLSGATDLPLMITDVAESIFHSVGGYLIDGKTTYNVENTISISEILKSWTIGGAYNISMEDKLGTIEKGKYADIAIFDRNLFETGMLEIKKAKVYMTIMNGEIVYK